MPLSLHTSAFTNFSPWLLWLPLCSLKAHRELHHEDYLPCWHNVYVFLLYFHFISIKGKLIVLFKFSDQLTVLNQCYCHIVCNTSLHCLISVFLTQSPLALLQNTSSFDGSSFQTLNESVHAVISPKTYFLFLLPWAVAWRWIYKMQSLCSVPFILFTSAVYPVVLLLVFLQPINFILPFITNIYPAVMKALWLPNCDLLKTILCSLQSHVAWVKVSVKFWLISTCYVRNFGKCHWLLKCEDHWVTQKALIFDKENFCNNIATSTQRYEPFIYTYSIMKLLWSLLAFHMLKYRPEEYATK